MNNILLINDMAGYGKVALSAMIPIMSNMKFQVYNLPTALVSNTLDYGKFDILETTGYMKNSMRVWDELGFEFDTIATGFLVSEGQRRSWWLSTVRRRNLRERLYLSIRSWVTMEYCTMVSQKILWDI